VGCALSCRYSYPTGQKVLFTSGTTRGMTDSDKLTQFLRSQAKSAGRQYEEARRAFREAREEASSGDNGDHPMARIVCRRHAEQREVGIDQAGRPDCFEAGHPDCEGCAEDVRAGRIETW
jgi:hypothetical protein